MDLIKLGKDSYYESDNFTIEFDYQDMQSSDHTSKTIAKDIVYLVTITNKLTGEVLRKPYNIVKMPIPTQLGELVDGTYYQTVDVYKRAPGWYISEQDGMYILEFVPKVGKKLIVKSRYGELLVCSGSHKSKSVVNAGVFLKALTGKSFSEIGPLLGLKNRFIVSTLVNEPTRDECLDLVMNIMVSKPRDFEADYRIKEIKRRLYDPHCIDTGNAKFRTKTNCSFSRRAEGTILKRDVLGFKSGIKLTKEMLDEIDESGIDTLIVQNDEGKFFELKKYEIADEEPDLSENELFTVMNMYACSLDGLDNINSRYELYNRRAESYDDIVEDCVKRAFSKLISKVEVHFITSKVMESTLKGFTFPPNDRDYIVSLLKRSTKENKISQGSETTNIISVETKKYKTTTDYNGRGNEEIIAVKPSEFGVHDPFNQPESKKVGFTNYRTLTSERDEDGSYKGKYVKIEDGVPKGEPVLLDAFEVTSSYIAPWDVDVTGELVDCYYGQRIVKVPKNKVQYQEYSPLNTLSLPTAISPFMNFNNGKRLVMSDNQSKQALPVLSRERPYVATGVVGMYGLGLIRAKDVLEKYYATNLVSNVTLEDFLKYRIHLEDVSASKGGYRDLLFTIETDEDQLQYNFTILSFKRSTEHTPVNYTIRTTEDGWYSGDDIVAYDDTVDIKDYDLEIYEDLAHQKVDPKVFNTDLALGNNFLVAWKTFDSTTLDDACTINAKLLGTGKLSHLCVYEEVIELSEGDNFREYFKRPNGVVGYYENGLPVVGSYLTPQSVVCYKYKKVKDKTTEINTSVRLDNVTEGVVVSAKIIDNRATVLLCTDCDAALGDKIAGNFGNKCVIAKIVPESQMPYTEDGRSVDIILNPLGVPSRMNQGQFLEGILGYVAFKSGKRFVITPNNRHSREIVLQKMEEYDIKPETLYNGKTGKPFPRKVNCGYAYIKKLQHLAVSKSNETGINSKINPVSLQTLKGKKEGGGQTIGEMEVWALSAAGANNFLQELFSIQSDDVQAKKAFKACPDSNILPQHENFNNEVAVVLSRLLGVDIVNEKKGVKTVITQKIMTDRDIRALSPRPIEETNSLQDRSIFGSTEKPVFASRARGLWSYIDLNCKIINPLWIYKSSIPNLMVVKEVINSMTGGVSIKSRVMSNEALKKVIYKDNKTEGQPSIAIREGLVYYTKEKELPTGFTWENGITAVVKAFENCHVMDSLNFYNNKLSNKNSESDNENQIFSLNETITIIKNLIDKGLDFKDFVISSYPVMPINYRLKVQGRLSDFDHLYSNIISSARASKNVDRSQSVFEHVCKLIGFEKNDKADRTNALLYFTGHNSDNDGYIRDHTLSKVVDMSFRGVIVPAEAGLIRPYEVGIPFKKIVTCLWDFLKVGISEIELDGVKYFECLSPSKKSSSEEKEFFRCISNKDTYALSELLDVGIDISKKLLTIINDYINEYCRSKKTAVALGRQPTLHQLGIVGLVPVPVEGISIRIHQLLCTAYNADFDGDQMYGVFSMSEKSTKELLDKMSPTSRLINFKDGSFVLEPTQDVLLGCYVATMLFDNEIDINSDERYDLSNIMYYSDLDTLKYDVDEGQLAVHSLVCYTHSNGNVYLSTAGRILFNSIIPNCFTDDEFTNPLNIKGINVNNYRNLRFDGLIKKKQGKENFAQFKMSSICEYVYSNFNGKMTCDILDDIFCFGTHYSEWSGISLSYLDFIEPKDLDYCFDKSKKVVDKINEYCELGLISDEDRKSSSVKVYRYVQKHVEKEMFDAYDRNNNLFIIIDSGARGNVSQLTQACGMIGVISRTSDDLLETPVLGNYCRGLTSAEQNYLAYPTRMGISAVQNDTADSGALTRREVYSMAGLRIVESDCHYKDTHVKVKYSEEVNTCKLNGEKADLKDLLDLKVLPEDPNYDYLVSDGKEKINSNKLDFIKKHHITKIVSDKGVFELRFNLTNTFKNMLYLRKCSDPEYSVKGVITKKCIDKIERDNPEFLNVRTILTCKSVGGVCSQCYGLESPIGNVPEVGTQIGIIAAQSIGEPATQLNMNRINAIGLSTGGNLTGVTIFERYASGGVPSGDRAIISKNEGTVSISPDGVNRSLLNVEGMLYKSNNKLLLVNNHEHVFTGQKLTDGFVNVNDIVLDDKYEELRVRQFTLLDIFFNLFYDSSIEVNARNFECLVRTQLSMARVISSNSDAFVPGEIYFINEIEKALSEDKDLIVKYYSQVEKSDVIINKYSGALTNLAFESYADNLAKVSTMPGRMGNDTGSYLNKIFIGESLDSFASKKLEPPKYYDSPVNNDEDEIAVDFDPQITDKIIDKVGETLASDSLTSLLDNLEIDDDFDLDESNSFGETEEIELEDYSEVEKESEEIKSSSSFINKD